MVNPRRPVGPPAFVESMPDSSITGIQEFFAGGRDRKHLSLTPLRRISPGITTFWDDPTRGSRLRFGLGSDQLQPLDMLDGLRQILEAFPAVGDAEKEVDARFPAFEGPEPA